MEKTGASVVEAKSYGEGEREDDDNDDDEENKKVTEKVEYGEEWGWKSLGEVMSGFKMDEFRWKWTIGDWRRLRLMVWQCTLMCFRCFVATV